MDPIQLVWMGSLRVSVTCSVAVNLVHHPDKLDGVSNTQLNGQVSDYFPVDQEF